MEQRIRIDNFMVHIKPNALTFSNTLYFEVYPVIEWEDMSTNETGISYIDFETEPDTRDVFEDGKCLMKLQGSYCWRGTWEGRLYFPDQEYWGSEIEQLSELYNKKIVPWCKDFIEKQEGRKLE